MMNIQKITVISLFFLLCNCQAIGNWADSVGERMPVVGERCEHWQCVTPSGRKISEENKRKEEQMKQAPAAAPQTYPTTAPTGAIGHR